MKVYIAGPMTGIPEYNYPAFRAAGEQLAALGFDVLNPVDIEDENTTGDFQEWRWYMRRAIRMVSDADGIALLPGWASSRGATLEHHIGKQLAIDVRPIGRWLN